MCVGEERRKVDARPRTWISVEPVVTNTLLQQCVGFRFDSVLPELHHAHFEITSMTYNMCGDDVYVAFNPFTSHHTWMSIVANNNR